MTVFVAWSASGIDPTLAGPWSSLLVVADGVTLVDSDESVSVVYHELKWSLPDDAALMVAPLAGRPKARGLRPGATTWLRDHVVPDGPGPTPDPSRRT